MSGWLGAVNYGVIVANEVDAFLLHRRIRIRTRLNRTGPDLPMPLMSRQEILAAIPHREPFLLVDEIVERGAARIVCTKTFSGDEDFFAGHYPGYPLVPGVLLCEAAMQSGAILLCRPLADTAGQSARGHAHERRAFQDAWSGPARRSASRSNWSSAWPTPFSSRPR